jgi:hypothetical protein
MAKHKRPSPIIADTTCGYIDNPLLIAIAMKTQLATAALMTVLYPPGYTLHYVGDTPLIRGVPSTYRNPEALTQSSKPRRK